MARLINGTLLVGDVLPAENYGEFTVSGAVFESQTTLDGSYALAPGFVVYLPAIDAFAFAPLPGVFHRYKLTSVTPVQDGTAADFTMLWDEPGDVEDYPQSNSKWLVSQVSPNRKYGNPPSESTYSDLPVGITNGAILLDRLTVDENIESGGGGGSAVTWTHVQAAASNVWTVTHNKNNSSFVATVFDASGAVIQPDSVVATSVNAAQITFATAVAGKAVFVFA